MQPFLLDRSSILERLGGDEDIYDVMAGMFIEDVDNNCTALAEALAAGDQVALKRAAHTVKGLLASFSDDSGAAAAFAVEQQLARGSLAGLEGAVAALQARLREVAAALG